MEVCLIEEQTCLRDVKWSKRRHGQYTVFQLAPVVVSTLSGVLNRNDVVVLDI